MNEVSGAAPAELPRHWHRRLRRGLLFVAIGAALASFALFASAMIAFVSTLDDPEPYFKMLVPGTLIALALTVPSLLIGGGLLASLVASIDRGGAFAALLLGLALFCMTGLLEVITPVGGIVWQIHASLGLLAIALLVAGLAAIGRSALALKELLGISDPRIVRSARRVRTSGYIVIAIALLLPFAPSLLPGVTPRVCMSYSGGVVALIVATPLLATAVLALRARRATDLANARYCPDCGYRRPIGARCSECGRTDAPSAPSV